MISKLRIDGFKSLSNFTIEFNSGLNILVGPNGSGKTNIISFIEFLSNLQEMSVSNAVSTSGGAGAILTKIGEKSFQDTIQASVSGKFISDSKTIDYVYSFTIGIFSKAEKISYKKQRIKLKTSRSDQLDLLSEIENDLDIETNVESNFKIKAKINRFDGRKFKKAGLLYPRNDYKKEDIVASIIILLQENTDPNFSLVSALRYFFEELYFVFNDLQSGKVFNIEPSKARIPEDSAKPPGIRKDGSGLYTTLYSIKQKDELKFSSTDRNVFYPWDRTEMYETTMREVLKYVQLANESIRNIEIVNNPFDNQLQIKIGLSGGDKSPILSLALMSDGTIKWITLITILLTNNSLLLIEEPENFLHPLMQSEIVSLMRSIANKNLIIMSTHSETILNSSRPNEIIIVSLLKGRTIAKRPTNSKIINREIRRTGFGLGYYYLSGSFDEK